MTFDEYIVNPMGRSNAVLNSVAREAIRTSYVNKFNAILVREHGDIKFNLYHDDNKNIYVGHFKIPSEVVPNFYYDTIIEFFTDENVKEAGTNLFKYNVRFYSNDPAYVYNYAYVFAQNNLFIEHLRSRMSKKALKTKAVEKNPGNNVGYVKSIYFAYLTMQRLSLNNVNTFSNRASKLNWSQIARETEDADAKVSARQAEQEKIDERKRKNKERRQEDNKDPNRATKPRLSLGVSKTKITGTTKLTRKTKISKKK